MFSLGEGWSMTMDRGREMRKAVGGRFEADREGASSSLGGDKGGGGESVLTRVENRRLEELGTLKFGDNPDTIVDWGRAERSVAGAGSSTKGLMVCMDLRRSTMAEALGRSLESTLPTSIWRRCDSSEDEGKLSAVGEQAGDEPADVTIVRWPEEMQDRRLPLLRKLSNCCPSCDTMLLVADMPSIDCSRMASEGTKEASLSLRS